MLAYIYQAALLCEDCGKAARAKCHEDENNPVVRIARERNCSLRCAAEYESHYDSDDYPKGPFDNGGGEADSPQHCDHCGVFLENDLTTDGANYVREQLAPWVSGDDDGYDARLVADRIADELRSLEFNRDMFRTESQREAAKHRLTVCQTWAQHYDWL